MAPRLSRDFYARDARAVARALLGQRLVHVVAGRRVGGRIVETEAYRGTDDRGAHWNLRRNLGRFAAAFGPPGVSLVYFTYGMHWLFNICVEPDGAPGAVLVRAIEPLEGLDMIAANRPGRKPHEWTSGPAKLTRALGIGPDHHGLDVAAPDALLFVEADAPIPDGAVSTGARVGLNTTPEPWKSTPWRYWITSNPHVSR
ncbi:MAG: DNA-3-methyladenine glycosylase [Anaerolineae bacterium]|nr:DNA-3-methyladenine glycosylase [Anaerolineae bacterium]